MASLLNLLDKSAKSNRSIRSSSLLTDWGIHLDDKDFNVSFIVFTDKLLTRVEPLDFGKHKPILYMLKNREINYYLKNDPERVNINPWDPTKSIKCSSIVQMHKDCIDNLIARDNLGSNKECYKIQRLALGCYKLEPHYFAEAAKEELSEDYYLDLYISKQLQTKPNSVFKFKD
jgi:hypothetical protein